MRKLFCCRNVIVQTPWRCRIAHRTTAVLYSVLLSPGWYLVDLRPMKEAALYFDKIKTSPPVHRVHIECFHQATQAVTNTRGNILTRTSKVRGIVLQSANNVRKL